MDTQADFTVERDEPGRGISLTGDWSAICLGDAGARLAAELKTKPEKIELGRVGRFDTAGALALIEALNGRVDERAVSGRPETLRLLHRVVEALKTETPTARRPWSLAVLLDRLGRGIVTMGAEGVDSMGFLG